MVELDLKCQNTPSDRAKRIARRVFGEGYTWTCSTCLDQYVLTQGKADYWYWKLVNRGEYNFNK